MADAFSEFEASSLFCPRCKKANPVRKNLLLVLRSGNKYDYTCGVCGTRVGGKTDSDSRDYYRLASASQVPPGARRKPPSRPPRPS